MTCLHLPMSTYLPTTPQICFLLNCLFCECHPHLLTLLKSSLSLVPSIQPMATSRPLYLLAAFQFSPPLIKVPSHGLGSVSHHVFPGLRQTQPFMVISTHSACCQEPRSDSYSPPQPPDPAQNVEAFLLDWMPENAFTPVLPPLGAFCAHAVLRVLLRALASRDPYANACSVVSSAVTRVQ